MYHKAKKPVNAEDDTPIVPRFDLEAERPVRGPVLFDLKEVCDFDVFAAISREVTWDLSLTWQHTAIMANILAGRPYNEGVRGLRAIAAVSQLVERGYLPITVMERIAP